MREQPTTDGSVEDVLVFLRENRGFDYRGYKLTSLTRRVNARMREVGVTGYTAYLDYLGTHPEEFQRLFDALLINVTSFFRDPLAWKALETQALPQLLLERGEEVRLCVWNAGCATGQEVYTTAIVLAETLGRDTFLRRVKIYGTDLDDDAVAIARRGAYDERELEGVPAALLKRYFQRRGARRAFDPDLRRAIVFGRHDLIQDAPISKVDILVCRNTLMYFNAETQERVLERLHLSMNEGGVLFLGRAEAIMRPAQLWKPIDLSRRLFAAAPGPRSGQRAVRSLRSAVVEDMEMKALAFDRASNAAIVLDAARCLALANERARVTFGIVDEHLRRPVRELPIARNHPTLLAALHRLQVEGGPVVVREREHAAPSFEVRATPLLEGGVVLGYMVTFVDIASEMELEEDAARAKTEVATMRTDFSATREALDTTNEELRTAIEELETTNEQLQSANDELEVVNEELSSSNEELVRANELLAEGARALARTNAQLEGFVEGICAGLALVDATLRVRIINAQVKELWGIDADELLGARLTDLENRAPPRAHRANARGLCCRGRWRHPPADVPRRDQPARPEDPVQSHVHAHRARRQRTRGGPLDGRTRRGVTMNSQRGTNADTALRDIRSRAKIIDEKVKSFSAHVRVVLDRRRGKQDSMVMERGSGALAEELTLAHEELAVADEELREQTDELFRTRNLAEQERQRYLELFNSSPMPKLLSDAYGVIVEANAAAATLLNMPARFLEKKPLLHFVARQDTRRFRKFVAGLGDREGEATCEVRIRPRHKPVVLVELTTSWLRSTSAPMLRWAVESRPGGAMVFDFMELLRRARDRASAARPGASIKLRVPGESVRLAIGNPVLLERILDGLLDDAVHGAPPGAVIELVDVAREDQLWFRVRAPGGALRSSRLAAAALDLVGGSLDVQPDGSWDVTVPNLSVYEENDSAPIVEGGSP